MFRFFRKKRKKREKIIEEKRSFTRGMLHRKEKLHTQQTHLLRLIHYYISKRAQLTTAFLLLFLRDTLRCSHESAFFRRFIRSRYILLSVLNLLLGRRAILAKIKRCRVTDNY